jgi:holo-[acyl-carrier protein] synthase
MILGLGIDMIEVARIQRAVERNPRFCDKIFTPVEIAYSEGKASRFKHLAARFAAKEAFIKAVGHGVPWASVGIENLPSGQPLLKVENQDAYGFSQAYVSLSHISDYALAVVILEKK